MKELEKLRDRIENKLMKYEKKYVKSEDGIIGLEIALIVNQEFEKFLNKRR